MGPYWKDFAAASRGVPAMQAVPNWLDSLWWGVDAGADAMTLEARITWDGYVLRAILGLILVQVCLPFLEGC